MAIDICYPPGADWGCAYTVDQLSDMREKPEVEAVMERSEALAWSTLQTLTGYRLSLCPVILRPCLARCGGGTWQTAPVMDGGFTPFISGGAWFNACGCRSDDCSCTSLCEVILPAEAGRIESVTLNGVVLDPSAYRVDNGRRLVRTDGDCWPACQDMTSTAEGSFLVSYYPGVAPNDLLRYAAGVLASEYYKACTDGECRLPSGVTNIARAGITMQIGPGLFSEENSGIPEVDAVIRIYNPAGLKSPPRVLSPDRARGRTQTWSA